MLRKVTLMIHPEKLFDESTKIWLAQPNFSFKYGSIKILFELTKQKLLIFLQFQKKKIASLAKKEKKKKLQIKIIKLLQN